MEKYGILKFDPIMHDLEYHLNLQTGNYIFNGIQDSDVDYLRPEFGDRNSDVTHVIQHISWLIWREGINQEIIEDFRNLLRCLRCTTAHDWVQKLIPFLCMRGLEREVADAILEYNDQCQQLQGDERITRKGALSFPDLYITIGDRLLLLKNDPDTAFKYYNLVCATWNMRPEDDDLSDTQKHWKKILPTFSSILNCEVPRDPDWGRLLLGANENVALCYMKCLEDLESSELYNMGNIDELVDNINRIPKSISDKLRVVLLIIEGIRRKHAFQILYSLSKEDMNTQQDLSDYVVAWACKLYDRRYRKLRNLAAHQALPKDKLVKLVYLLSEVAGRVEHILDFLRVIDDQTVAAYYTSYNTFSLMLPDICKEEERCGKLSVMHINYMNDPNEGKTFHRLIFGEDEKSHHANPPYVFLKCFTPMKDYLPMWNMYADRAQGVCVVIDTKEMDSLYHVCYVGDNGNIRQQDNKGVNTVIIKQSIDRFREIAKQVDHDVLDDFLAPLRYLFKDHSYCYEQEIRMIYSFDRLDPAIKKTTQNPPKLMVFTEEPIQIKELILGPKFPDLAVYLPYLQEELERMAEITDTEIPEIIVSEIKYR